METNNKKRNEWFSNGQFYNVPDGPAVELNPPTAEEVAKAMSIPVDDSWKLDPWLAQNGCDCCCCLNTCGAYDDDDYDTAD